MAEIIGIHIVYFRDLITFYFESFFDTRYSFGIARRMKSADYELGDRKSAGYGLAAFAMSHGILKTEQNMTFGYGMFPDVAI